MKRTLVLVLLVLIAGFAVASDLGLEVGSEVGFGDVVDDITLAIAPLLKYEKSIDALDISLWLQYFIVYDISTFQYLYFEPEVTYTLPAGPGSLTFGLYSELYYYTDPSSIDTMFMLEPNVKYLQGFDFGDLFVKVGLPFAIEPSSATNIYGTLGYGKDGFGLELTGHYNLDPAKEVEGFEALVSYEKGAVYGEVEISTDKDFKVFTLSPYVELYANRFTFWAGVDFGNIGDEDLDVSVEPKIGATYKF